MVWEGQTLPKKHYPWMLFWVWILIAWNSNQREAFTELPSKIWNWIYNFWCDTQGAQLTSWLRPKSTTGAFLQTFGCNFYFSEIFRKAASLLLPLKQLLCLFSQRYIRTLLVSNIYDWAFLLKTILLKKVHRRCLTGSLVRPWFQITEPAIICSKLTMETLEQGVKYVQS